LELLEILKCGHIFGKITTIGWLLFNVPELDILLAIIKEINAHCDGGWKNK
jgi:hypothetical protein